MNTPTLLVVLAGSNVACLFLGYLFGRLTQATVRIEETMETDPAAPDAEAPTPPSRPPLPRTVTWTLMAMAVGVVAIGLGTAAVGYQVTRNQDRLTGCVAGYSNALADALEARSAPQRQATEQLDKVMAAILEAYNEMPEAGRVRVQGAIKAYVDARADSKRALAENPYPDAPRDACAELTN